MLLLTSTSDLVRVVTDAAGDIEAHASFVDNLSGAITPVRTNTASITSATTTTVVASPAASTQRNVKHLNLRNNHASQAVLVTVFHTDGTNQEDLFECTLLAGEALVLDQMGCWTHYDANGAQYPTGTVAATQAEMEAGSSLTTLVTPGRLHFHPGVAKVWCKCGVTGNMLANYNMTSVTDTGAGQATFTIATDFSSAEFAALATVERSVTTLAVSDLKYCAIRSSTQAAGSIQIECWDGTAATAIQEDPTAYHFVGLGDHA